MGRYREVDIKEIRDIRGSKKVKIKGRVEGIECFKWKSGKGETFKMSVSDDTDAIECVYLLNFSDYKYKKIKRVFNQFKVGNRVIVEGEVSLDKEYHRVNVPYSDKSVLVPVNQIKMEKIKKDDEIIRFDNEKEKRVEFQVVTKYTTQQSIVDIKELVDLVGENNMNHNAIAITDKASVHGFPSMEKVIKGTNIKPIYGSEFRVSYDTLSPIENGIPTKEEIENQVLVFFDLETSGLRPVFDEIIEVGAVKILNGKVIDEFHALIKPSKPIKENIIKLTGITNELLEEEGRNDEIEVLKEFKDFVGDNILIGHNVTFDYDFIQHKCKSNNLTFNFNANLVIDTMKMAVSLFKMNGIKAKSFRLNTLFKHYSKKIEEHHRAKEDAYSTFVLFDFLLNGRVKKVKKEEVKENGYFDYDLTSFLLIHKRTEVFHNSRSRSKVLVYAKNQKGLKSLYQLITMANIEHVDSKVIPYSEIEKRREDLLLISGGFEADEIYEKILKGKAEIDEWKRFDAIGMHSHTQNYNFKDLNEEQIKKVNKTIIKLAKKEKIIIVVLGNVHYLNENEEKYHKVIVNEAKRSPNPLIERYEKPNAYFKTTEEMLKEFTDDNYLSEKKAKEIIITNTNLLASKIRKVEVIPKKLFAPYLKDADKNLIKIADEKMKELYGDNVPTFIKERKEREEKLIIDGGYGVIYYGLHKIVRRSLKNGIKVLDRGSVGSSFYAYLTDLSEVNPLSPHYYCSSCKTVERIDGVESGFDLPPERCKCGGIKNGDGHDIPFEMFVGIPDTITGKVKTPDIDLNFSGELYQKKAHEHAKEIFGEENVIRAGTISTYQDKKTQKAIWDYFKESGVQEELLIEELKYDLSKFYYFDSKTNSYKKQPYIHGIKDKIVFDELKEVGKKGNKTQKVVRITFGFRSSYYDEYKNYINGVKNSTGQHAGGSMIIPFNMDFEDFFPTSYNGDGRGTKKGGKIERYKTSHMDYKPYEDSVLKLDMLGHDDPTRFVLLEKETGLKVDEIPYYDEEIINEFRIGNTQRISEFNTQFSTKVTMDINPKNFSDLVRVSGWTHGTGVYLGNAEELLKKGYKNNQVISSREDMLKFLENNGLESGVAFNILEKVRKGKGVTLEEEELMVKSGIPNYYIDSMMKIQYLFPKAHATAYVRSAFRLMYYKKHYPLQFTKVMLDLQVNENDLDFLPLLKEIDEFGKLVETIKEKERKFKADNKEKSSLKDFELVLYIKKLGYDILPVDFNKSDESKFLYEDSNKLRMPLSVIPDFKKEDREKVINTRKENKFNDLEDVKKHITKNEKKLNYISQYCGWGNE